MDRRKAIRAVVGLVLVALGVFVLVSVATHDGHEGPFPDFPANQAVQNACGVAGAHVSAYALALFGWASYLLGGAVALAGGLLACGRRPADLHFRLPGLVLAVVGLVLGLALANSSPYSTAGAYVAGPGTAGGAAGVLLAGVLYGAVGATGTLLLFALFGGLGVFLLAGAEVGVLAEKGIELGGRLWRRPRDARRTRRAARQTAEPASRPTDGQDVIERAPARPEPEEEPEEEMERPRPVREPEVLHAASPPQPSGEEFDIPDPSPSLGDYELPPLALLEEVTAHLSGEDEAEIRERSRLLERTLGEFRVEAEVVRIQRGPVITMYELSLAPGTKVSKVESLADDLAIALKAPNVRIVAPLPGRNTVGIEVPNAERELVGLRELMEGAHPKYRKHQIPLFLGKDTAGSPLVLDLASCPHLLVAGATGSGKSVAINAMISSILMTRTPEDVQLLLIDPKAVEFSDYSALPHLLCPILTDMKKAASVLKWACKKMDERYSLLSAAGVRNLRTYNNLSEEEIIGRLDPDREAELDDVPFHMPHIVIICDEFGELMMVAAKEVENSVTRLSQKARAVGIHLICATQRPSVDVITGLIKANLPARVAFQVSSKVDSRTILDRNGADLLLGRGDMLLLPPGTSRLVRAQGTFVSEEEVARIVAFLEEQSEPQFRAELREMHAREKGIEHEDDLYEDAVRVILQSRRGSVSLLQRRLSIGYSRAARLVDMMAEAGVVGPHKGSQPRDVLMTLEEWEQAHAQQT